MDDFSDIVAANESFVQGFQHSELTGTARKGLAIITCMDSRISPLAVVGMQAGDANTRPSFLSSRRKSRSRDATHRLPNGS
jgi:carbonic anhydrase